MTISLNIANVTALDKGVWKAKLAPEDLLFLGDTATRLGPMSVLILSDAASFDRITNTLRFSPAIARVLNFGSTDATIIVESRSTSEHVAKVNSVAAQAKSNIGGDAAFLAALPSNLLDLGRKLMSMVRAKYPGALRFFPTSGKFVETPDNFWTIRIQPRDVSFRVTVRGRPGDFVIPGSLAVKPDMGTYSSFKVSAPNQLSDLMEVLQQVRRKGRRL